MALDTHVEAVIYCDAPVALPVHRIIASALDMSLVLIALGVFLLTFHVAGGEIVLNRYTMPFFARIAAVLALFYHFLFCICGGDTAGMQWTQLRLVNFDGQTPDREQRRLPACGQLPEPGGRGSGFDLGAGGRRESHLARSTFPRPFRLPIKTDNRGVSAQPDHGLLQSLFRYINIRLYPVFQWQSGSITPISLPGWSANRMV